MSFASLRTSLAAASLFAVFVAPAVAQDIEPSLRLVRPTAPREVALTFDACSGDVDHRILDMLVAERIPATIFVTARWLKRNGPALAVMTEHPDLFEIENHGADHIPVVTDAPTVFGLKTAGTPEAVRAEVDGGAAAILEATGQLPHWFRGATARYSRDAVAQIENAGYRIAGYSLNADMGAALPAATVEKRLMRAADGDVVIAHINQPHRSAGAGVAAGILALKRAGATFVRLEDAAAEGNENGPKPVHHPSS